MRVGLLIRKVYVNHVSEIVQITIYIYINSKAICVETDMPLCGTHQCVLNLHQDSRIRFQITCLINDPKFNKRNFLE